MHEEPMKAEMRESTLAERLEKLEAVVVEQGHDLQVLQRAMRRVISYEEAVSDGYRASLRA